MMKQMTDIEGVFADGAHVGIKPSGRKDLAFIYVPNAVASAGVFTQNKCCGANITQTKKALKTTTLKAVIVNSGNSNAATGKKGMENCRRMAQKAAHCLGLSMNEVGIASTGIIGVQLDIDTVEAGIERLLTNKHMRAGSHAAEAIMTTDLFQKVVYKEKKIGKKIIKVAGIAKGSGMIEPNMATMLGFLVTNIDIEPSLFQKWFKDAVDQSFNMISVDTDTSTSDMVLAFATGEHKISLVDKEQCDAYTSLLLDCCIDLAKQIVKDGEGATKLIECQVSGAATHRDARFIAKSVINSPLVKTAIYGEDANWGRLLMAVGKTPGIKINKDKLSFSFGTEMVFSQGEPIAFDRKKITSLLKKDTVVIHIDLGLSSGNATAWGCDLTQRYIEINVDYN
jgi:glutamate N-acetyltransferase/amino-acid N-acetyltransferase